MTPVAFEVAYAGMVSMNEVGTPYYWVVQIDIQHKVVDIWKDQLYHNVHRGAYK